MLVPSKGSRSPIRQKRTRLVNNVSKNNPFSHSFYLCNFIRYEVVSLLGKCIHDVTGPTHPATTSKKAQKSWLFLPSGCFAWSSVPSTMVDPTRGQLLAASSCLHPGLLEPGIKKTPFLDTVRPGGRRFAAKGLTKACRHTHYLRRSRFSKKKKKKKSRSK